MKRILLFLASLLFMLNGFAQYQRNLVMTSGSDEPIQVYINNRLINHRALKKIRVKGLTENYYEIKVVFVYQPRKTVFATLYIPPLSEIVYKVIAPQRRHPHGNFVIKAIYPIDEQLPYYQSDMVFDWGYQINPNGQNGVSQTGQINININNTLNNAGMSGTPVVSVPDYAGEVGCTPPVTPERFESMLNAVRNQDFESSKLRVAKQIIKTNDCMTVSQLVQILNLFDFDQSKLKLAKYAYNYVYDIENYYKVYNVFDFESYKRQLENYINSMD